MNPAPQKSARVRISRKEYEALKADKQRLDYLDECNRRLNAKSGTLYGWKLAQSPNVTRLMLDFPNGVDLHDSEAVGCHPTGMLSIRKAIDSATGYRTGSTPDPDTIVNAKLMEWFRIWKLDGDLVRCRECNRGIIYSRRDESLAHSSECSNRLGYPWELLVALTPPPTNSTSAQDPE